MNMKVKPGYKQTEVGVIPEDWKTMPVGEAGGVLGGRQRSPYHVGQPTKYLRVANVFDGFIDTKDVLEMPFSPAEKQRFQLKDGDILLNEGQSIELVGRSAIYRGKPENCCFQNTLVRFRAGHGTCSEFVQLVFQQYLRTGIFASIALQTTSIAHLGSGRLAALKIPFPTKAEQEAIAEALSDADALIESLEKLLAKKRQIKQGAMQDLLTGKKRLPGFEVKRGYKQTEMGVIPEDWEVSAVGDEFSIQLGKMLDSEKNVGAPKPFLGNRAVQWGRLDLGDIGVVRLTPSDLQRFRLRADDLLVCEGGEIGRCAIWHAPIEECYYQKALHRLRPKRGYNVKLMLNVLCRLASSGFLLNFVTQTSIAHLSKEKLETVPIPLPPTKAEQEAIAAILSDMDAEIGSLEAKLTKARQLKQGMMQELLTGRIRLV
ncbi:MAG TPA: restriction endonuclease subunit S [Thermoanaerobaculia bacterium]|nr:restriction endonuclease subunit S [Thermoanaerobaculia bacterium]